MSFLKFKSLVLFIKIVPFLSFLRDRFTLLYQNSVTDVSAGFRPPCWCPSRWAPAWCLHTNLYKFVEIVSPHIFHKKKCFDLNLGESLCISTFFLFPDSRFNLLNGFDFLFWSILNDVTLKTSNKSECLGLARVSFFTKLRKPEIATQKHKNWLLKTNKHKYIFLWYILTTIYQQHNVTPIK